MNKTRTGAGTIFVVLLQLVFIILKLCNVIAWSWVFVLMPLIVYTGVCLIWLIILFILSIVAGMDK